MPHSGPRSPPTQGSTSWGHRPGCRGPRQGHVMKTGGRAGAKLGLSWPAGPEVGGPHERSPGGAAGFSSLGKLWAWAEGQRGGLKHPVPPL